jgi:hypothetical protein
MDCRRCGLSNPPYVVDCDFCSEAMQSEAEAEGRRREWDALGEPARREFENLYRRDRDRYDAWVEKLRRDRKKHALIGAVAYGLGTNLLLLLAYDVGPFGLLLLLLADAAVGAAVGFRVNSGGGGEYRGLALFGGAYVVSVPIKMMIGVLPHPLAGGFEGAGVGLAVAIGILQSLLIGYLFGLHLSLKKSVEE